MASMLIKIKSNKNHIKFVKTSLLVGPNVTTDRCGRGLQTVISHLMSTVTSLSWSCFKRKKHSNKKWGGHNKKASKILLEFRFDAKFVSRQKIQI
jgi:hypothetical protein